MSRWVPNATKNETNNMKSKWPTPASHVGTQRHLYSTCSHWGLALGVTQILAFAFSGNAIICVFRYQHVGIPNAKLWHWGSKSTRGPNANVLRRSGR